MSDALIDSNVVFAARNSSDSWHQQGGEIVRAMDSGDLPRGLTVSYCRPEILNPIHNRGGQSYTLETLEFLEGSTGFLIRRVTGDDFAKGLVRYRQSHQVGLTDCITVTYMRRVGIQYISSFDDDFDQFDGVTRLNTDSNPFEESNE